MIRRQAPQPDSEAAVTGRPQIPAAGASMPVVRGSWWQADDGGWMHDRRPMGSERQRDLALLPMRRLRLLAHAPGVAGREHPGACRGSVAMGRAGEACALLLRLDR